MHDDNRIIKETMLSARKYAKAKNLNYEQGEDFVQSFVIARHVRKSKQSLEQAMIDFMRKEFGDTRMQAGAVRAKSRKDTCQYELNNLTTTKYTPSESEAGIAIFEIRSRIDRLNIRQKLILRRLVQQKKQKDIAKILGVTKGRINQIAKQLKNILKIDSFECIKYDWI